MLRHWRQLSLLMRVGVIAIAALVGLYALSFAGWSPTWWATSGDVDRERVVVAKLQDDVVRLAAQRQEHERRLTQIANLSKNLWPGQTSMPTNEIQATIERLGAQAGVRLNRVGKPGVVDLSDHLKAVEVQVSAQTTPEALAHFLQAVENQRPLLEWATCTLSPNAPANATSVQLTGKLRALVLVRGENKTLKTAPGAAPAPGSARP